ncbi:MAG: lytic transglycosylase domain-containing protein [Vicinamibacterales bacterium]|nr:lytic transglycosylase domain-containing protein [Vicinamibacterales bacterium]
MATAEPVLAGFAARESIRALLSAGDLEAALAALATLEGTIPADLLLRSANAERAGGRLEQAAALYRRARASAGRTAGADEAALGLAATLEQDGKPREALETFRELQLTFRQPAAYDAATQGANRLSSQLGGEAPLSEQDYEAIVDRLTGAAAFQRAVDAQLEWKARFPSSLQIRQIDAAIVQNLYALRADERARAQAEAFLRTYPDSTEAVAAAVTIFRLDVREGKTSGVERRGRAIIAGEIKGASLEDRQAAARLLAEYLVSVGEARKGLAVYDQLLLMTRSRGDRIDIRWRTAIAALRSDDPTRATRELREILRLKPDAETERATTFWLGYAQDAVGEKAAARALWADLVVRYPYTYYGNRAATRLGIGPPEPSLAFPALTLRDVVTAHPDYKGAALLSQAGLLQDAAVFARRLQSSFRRDDAVALLAARASEAAGDHASASNLMSSFFGDYLQKPATGLPVDFWALAYPQAFWTEVSTAAARHRVDPLLMLGLARQESHFDPAARSPVGAVGLFQLMPYTAAEIDPAFAQPGAVERLLDPAVSAELGAAHLAQHLVRFGGALAPTIASYNADRLRVQAWWDEAKALPEEMFIDSIPYRQTRAYVRQVLANYEMYRRAFGRAPDAQSTSPQR